MNKLRQFLAILAVALLVVGCVSSVRHRPPFNQYRSGALTTQRPAILYRDGARGDTIFSPPKQVLYLSDQEFTKSDYRYKNRVVAVPAGQEVRLLEVEQVVGDGIIHYNAIGEVYVPAWKRFVRFHHNWGYNGKVFRAPWDSAAVPDVRSF